MIKPYDDQDMIYDTKKHSYRLTKGCVYDELGLNLNTRLNASKSDNPSKVADIALKQISAHLYTFVYARTGNKLYVEMLLAKYEPCREIIKQCLLNETMYAITNGTFWNYAGVNMSDGRVIELSALRDSRVVSTDTEQILYQTLPNGVCLLHQGNYVTNTFILYEDY